jgi:hypothetical protein
MDGDAHQLTFKACGIAAWISVGRRARCTQTRLPVMCGCHTVLCPPRCLLVCLVPLIQCCAFGVCCSGARPAPHARPLSQPPLHPHHPVNIEEGAGR